MISTASRLPIHAAEAYLKRTQCRVMVREREVSDQSLVKAQQPIQWTVACSGVGKWTVACPCSGVGKESYYTSALFQLEFDDFCRIDRTEQRTVCSFYSLYES